MMPSKQKAKITGNRDHTQNEHHTKPTSEGPPRAYLSSVLNRISALNITLLVMVFGSVIIIMRQHKKAQSLITGEQINLSSINTNNET